MIATAVYARAICPTFQSVFGDARRRVAVSLRP